ncbi:hypothetical protein LXL04_038887 [Taraxacum kok-saghyz]
MDSVFGYRFSNNPHSGSVNNTMFLVIDSDGFNRINEAPTSPIMAQRPSSAYMDFQGMNIRGQKYACNFLIWRPIFYIKYVEVFCFNFDIDEGMEVRPIIVITYYISSTKFSCWRFPTFILSNYSFKDNVPWVKRPTASKSILYSALTPSLQLAKDLMTTSSQPHHWFQETTHSISLPI